LKQRKINLQKKVSGINKYFHSFNDGFSLDFQSPNRNKGVFVDAAGTVTGGLVANLKKSQEFSSETPLMLQKTKILGNN
jgi:hypothetical protein